MGKKLDFMFVGKVNVKRKKKKITHVKQSNRTFIINFPFLTAIKQSKHSSRLFKMHFVNVDQLNRIARIFLRRSHVSDDHTKLVFGFHGCFRSNIILTFGFRYIIIARVSSTISSNHSVHQFMDLTSMNKGLSWKGSLFPT